MKNITSNLIKVISNYNIYPGIKIEHAKKTSHLSFSTKNFGFCQNSSVPFHQVTFYRSFSS